MSEISEQEKELYQRAAARRRENGVRLKQVRMFVLESQAEAFYEVFENAWVTRYGKTGAMDLLIRCISAGEARIQDEIRARKEKKRGKTRRPSND